MAKSLVCISVRDNACFAITIVNIPTLARYVDPLNMDGRFVNIDSLASEP
jgi:hypothetical protein